VTGTLTGLVRLVTAGAHEGPTWFADEDALYVTTARGPRGTAILRIALDGLVPVGPDAVTVLRADANVANGMAADAAGRLIVCEQGSRTTPARITAVDRATGAATTLVDSYRGLPLNSPNDVAVCRDGTI
jgi:gluconolactonase